MIKVYCDGACSGNPGPGAWGYIAFYKDQVIFSESGYCKSTTNNQMELRAAISALKMFDECEVIVDSKYVLDGITTWVHVWKKNNWKSTTGSVKNKELWEDLDKLNSKRDIKWTWQKGHAKSIHDYADLLAKSLLEFNLNKF